MVYLLWFQGGFKFNVCLSRWFNLIPSIPPISGHYKRARLASSKQTILVREIAQVLRRSPLLGLLRRSKEGHNKQGKIIRFL
jgi:hypothetical protein